jgi:hypothetical protein
MLEGARPAYPLRWYCAVAAGGYRARHFCLALKDDFQRRGWFNASPTAP